MRALGFVALTCLTICNILIRPRVPPCKTGPLVELAAFTELPYALFASGMFLILWGVYFAFYYIGTFGVTILTMPEKESINLLLVLNGVGIIGRTVPAYLADRYTGPLNTLLFVTAASVVCAHAMIGVTSQRGIYVWAVAYGIVGNAIQGIYPAVLGNLTAGLQSLGVRMGMIFVRTVLTCPIISGCD